MWVIGGLVLLVVAAIVVVLIVNRGHFGPTMLTERDPVVLTEIENMTGNKELDGAVAQGLQLALAQSPYLMLRSGDDYRLTRRQVLATLPDAPETANEQAARTIAQRLGTRAYLYGSIKGSTPPYLLHCVVAQHSHQRGDEFSRGARAQPAGGAGRHRPARRRSPRRHRGGFDSISRNHNALSREATANMDALREFSLAEDALIGGRTLEALRLYQQTVTLEPRFTLAYLRLTVLYRKQRAEVAAAEASKLALATADNTSERLRTIAQYEYEMNSSGDYNRAASLIRKLVTDNPKRCRRAGKARPRAASAGSHGGVAADGPAGLRARPAQRRCLHPGRQRAHRHGSLRRLLPAAGHRFSASGWRAPAAC